MTIKYYSTGAQEQRAERYKSHFENGNSNWCNACCNKMRNMENK